MPWNDNANPGHSPGPWGSPPSEERSEESPRRRPPAPPPPAGPDLAEYLRRLRDAWDRRVGGRRLGRFRGQVAGVAVGLLTITWLASGAYVVGPSERAVVTRLGALARTEGPGLHWRLPYPFERAQLIEVNAPQKTVVGDGPDGGLTLTRDLNLANVAYSVEWRVTNPVAALFQARDPDEAVKAAADSAVRAAVGRRSLDEMLSGDKAPIEAEALAQAQQTVSRLHAGIVVTALRIESVAPPEAAGDAWRDVARASQEAQVSSDQANDAAVKKETEAVGEAWKVSSDADAYEARVVHEAKGEALRFDQVLAAYRRAPAVTRERLYLETMQKVMSRAHVVVVDAKGTEVVVSPAAASPAPPATKPAAGAP
ncbi:MAG: FtsH protease activity modulator HflK [Caulobacteraceae bacterium]|jgi:membrane protease subunit HflK